MMVNNVIWGDKYLMWQGSITITCPENGLWAEVDLREEDQHNLISGKIGKGDTELYTITGVAGGVTSFQETVTQKKPKNQRVG